MTKAELEHRLSEFERTIDLSEFLYNQGLTEYFHTIVILLNDLKNEIYK